MYLTPIFKNTIVLKPNHCYNMFKTMSVLCHHRDGATLQFEFGPRVMHWAYSVLRVKCMDFITYRTCTLIMVPFHCNPALVGIDKCGLIKVFSSIQLRYSKSLFEKNVSSTHNIRIKHCMTIILIQTSTSPVQTKHSLHGWSSLSDEASQTQSPASQSQIKYNHNYVPGYRIERLQSIE